MAAPDHIRSRHQQDHLFLRPERDEERPLERLEDDPELERTPEERDELPLDRRTVPDERDELPVERLTLPDERDELPEDRRTDEPLFEDPVERPIPEVRERVLALRPTAEPVRLLVREGTARVPEVRVPEVRVVERVRVVVVP